MTVRFDLRAILIASLLLGASCAEEEAETDESAATDEENGDEDAKKDAGASKDGGKDAGKDGGVKRDASSDDDVDASTEEEEEEEEEEDADDAGKDAGGGSTADAGGGGGATDKCADLTYEKFGKSFTMKYCLTCHNGDNGLGGIDVSTLESIKENATDIDAHAVKKPAKNPMPPEGQSQPTAAEKQKLGEWLTCETK